MKLKSSQVKWIEQDLTRRGVTYGPLQEDLLDHLCMAVEARMAAGMRFMEAYEQSVGALEPTGLAIIQQQTFRTLTPTTLIRNYFLVAFRSLLKQKWHSVFNLLGLTIGLAACLMIFLFIRYEAGYDTQHPVKNLYRLVTDVKRPSGENMFTAMSGAPWGPQMVEEFPEILDKARFMKYRLDVPVSHKAGDKHFMEAHLIWADQEALQFFDLPLVLGDQASALQAPKSVVISEATAARYFGSEDPLGKVLTYNDEVDLVVTGVMKNMPENMHFKADIIGSFNTLGTAIWNIVDDWNIIYYYTYFELKQGADLEALKAGFPAFFEKHVGQEWSQYRTFDLQKVTDIYLHSHRSSELKANSDSAYLYLLAAIAFIILLLACANFINLNIARSLQRLREVGVRKVMGSSKTDLLIQFVTESFLMVLLASLLALFTASLALPYFNQLLDKSLSIMEGMDLVLVGYVLLVLLLVSVLSGIFPALAAARLSAVGAMKGQISKGIGGSNIKNTLLLFQFAMSAILIIAIGTIKMQQDYIANKDLGYEKDRLLMVSMPEMTEAQMQLVKESLLSLPVVEGLSYTSHKLAGDQSYHANYAFSQAGKTESLNLGRLHIDRDFINTYQLKLLAGRDFLEEVATDTASFLINETVVRRLGLPSNQEAVGITIDYATQGAHGRYPRRGRVIGVVNDFHFESLHHNLEGFVMDIQPARYHFYACRINSKDSRAAEAAIQAKIQEVLPGRPPEHFWLTDQLSRLYRAEYVFDRLISIASAMAIVLALFGLLSLVLQLVSTRRKEVGVRKVLGAGTPGIVWLFVSKFGRVLTLNFLLAWPLAYWWMSQWLSQFPFRIAMPWTLFMVSAVLLTCLALACIAFSTLNVARMNPANSLRYD